jgi:hypothetical protein
MDDSNTMDRWSANILLAHNNDRFAPTIKCNTVLDGNVHMLHLVDAEEICILYDNGLIVTQMAARRRCGSAILPSRDPVFEVLVCYRCAIDVTVAL